MNEPDLINNKYQLHLAMEMTRQVVYELFYAYKELTGREYKEWEGYRNEDAETILIVLGSSYDTALEAVDRLRQDGKKVGAITLHMLRPFPAKEVCSACRNAKRILVADRQDSYGAGGGNLTLEIRAAMQKYNNVVKIKSLVYGLGGMDFYVEDAIRMFEWVEDEDTPDFDYYGITPGKIEEKEENFFAPLTAEKTKLGLITVAKKDGELTVSGGTLNATTQIPKRIAPGHGACPGCGIPVNLNLLLRAIEDPVVLLFQTGCGMIVTTSYPRTSFKVPYLHNLFQNGAATLSGLAEICYRKQKKGEIPQGDIVFVMVSGDGGLDIGMGSAIGTALRGHRLLIFEYDNGGYMNTGYQLSYSTPKGARSSTSHIGKEQYGKTFYHKDMPQIMAAANVPYVATVAESNPADFIKKAAKAADYAKKCGVAYVKALSACPLNWNDKPNTERSVIAAAVDSCFFPLYEVEQGKTKINYNPEENGKKIPVLHWLSMMGRTKHLRKEEYADIVEDLQSEVDRRFMRLKVKSENPYL